MRDNVEAFTAGGGNVAFLSGNVCWFQSRFDLNASRQICYKDARFDPLYPAQGHLVTVNWWDRPVCLAETAVTGVSFYGTAEQQAEYHVLEPNHWVFERLEFDEASTFGTYDHGDGEQTVVGGETDAYQQGDSDPCTPRSPDGFTSLAEVYGRKDPGKVVCTMGIFTQGEGQMFTAATLNWSLGLTQGDVRDSPIDRITRNVFERLG
jgi:hypothetical protein